MPDPWELRRNDFPMLSKTMHGHPLVYLDSGATAQKPQVVIDAISNYYKDHYGTVHRAVYDLATYATNEYNHVREKVRRFLNASKVEEIIFTRGTTESINMIATSFGKAFIAPGDEIIISAIEHHSNIVPWQMACEDRGAILKVIPVDDNGELMLEEYAKLLGPKTRIVAFNHISNAIGTVNPVKQMVRMAHDAGAKVLIDGAQAAPQMPVDVQDLDADFYVFSGHKLFGPTGIGILFAKEELLNAMPPYQGGGDMIETVTFEKTTYNVPPMKFEAGTPMIAEVIGLGAAVDYLQSVGMDRVHQREQELLAYATPKVVGIDGLRIIGTAKEKGAIIGFVVDGVHPLDLGTLLDLKGICVRTGHHCAQPAMKRFGVTGTVRASFAFYNTFGEIDYFVDKLKDVIRQLRS
jgi:cysteine desulfurase/selenocysteine lyase